MKKIVLLGLLFCASCSFKQIAQNSSSSNFSSGEAPSLPMEIRTSIDDKWDQYTNYDFSFSIKIPRSIQVKTMSGSVNLDQGAWKIEKAFVPEDQLLDYVKKRFGPDCYIEDTAPWIPEYVKQIIVTVPPEIDFFGKTKCLPRYSAWAILYNPKNELLIYWDQGQEDRFYGSGAIMSSSFRFLD